MITEPFFELKTDNKYILFVNSEQPPDKETPLNQFIYLGEEGDSLNNYRFFRLYQLSYNQTIDGITVVHKRFDYLEIKIKEHCKSALKQMIDSFSSVSEFLLQLNQGN